MSNIFEKIYDKTEEIIRKTVIGKEDKEESVLESGATYNLRSVFPSKEIQEQVMKYLQENEN